MDENQNSKTIDADICISFPGSGRTWLRAMLYSDELNYNKKVAAKFNVVL